MPEKQTYCHQKENRSDSAITIWIGKNYSPAADGEEYVSA